MSEGKCVACADGVPCAYHPSVPDSPSTALQDAPGGTEAPITPLGDVAYRVLEVPAHTPVPIDGIQQGEAHLKFHYGPAAPEADHGHRTEIDGSTDGVVHWATAMVPTRWLVPYPEAQPLPPMHCRDENGKVWKLKRYGRVTDANGSDPTFRAVAATEVEP